MRVLELWRYPVKSLQGERLEVATVTTAGIEGDRRFALFDIDTGFGLTARRVPELLFAAARLRDRGKMRRRNHESASNIADAGDSGQSLMGTLELYGQVIRAMRPHLARLSVAIAGVLRKL